MKAELEQKIERLLSHQVADVIVRESLEKKLRSGRKLRIKLGADPSRPDLHIGHAVVLRKLREFMELGHTIIFIVGDFTARIGDPTGKSKTRPMLSAAEIESNAATYFEQVGKILGIRNSHFSDWKNVKKKDLEAYLESNSVVAVPNSLWLKSLNAARFLGLTSKFTVARITERDDFEKRLKQNMDVHMHELLYPMLQAYDSIVLGADVEIGATDQRFNMLAGRELAKKNDLPEQDVIACPILLGTDGREKMSKSLDNYIGIMDSADAMFGKTMSIPDDALDNWLELAADLSNEEIVREKMSLAKGENPRDVKMRLAKRLAAMYHGAKAAEAAEVGFKARFQKRETLEPTLSLEIQPKIGEPYKLYELVSAIFEVSSSQARRDIEGKGVKVNGVIIDEPNTFVDLPKEGIILQKGKLHIARVKPLIIGR